MIKVKGVSTKGIQMLKRMPDKVFNVFIERTDGKLFFLDTIESKYKAKRFKQKMERYIKEINICSDKVNMRTPDKLMRYHLISEDNLELQNKIYSNNKLLAKLRKSK